MRRKPQPRAGHAPRGAVIGLAVAALVTSTLAGTSVATEDAASVPEATSAALGGESTAVTLITGDTVRMTTIDGRRAVTIDHAEGRERVAVHQLEIDDQLYVMPADVIPYLGEDLLDRELFNVDALISQGFDDASSDALPVIATYGGQVRAGEVSAFSATSTEEILDSIDAAALAVDKDDADRFWESVTAGEVGAQAMADEPALAGGVQKLWLDAQVQADLHDSTEQIGAPAAWDAGIDGSGVTVAVLDTGVDADHPDLAGKVVAEENFSGAATPQDGNGHGTHVAATVAATVAGTGAGSGGLRAGVAPGAMLISGKVLDDGGRGLTSDIIAGMEWAADAGADIVNLSLGGPVSDGIDPLSDALNALSDSHDVLFVVAAGNDGPGSTTVSSPGSADSALTVGAVDRDDVLADFSSRGPRWLNMAVKPDITAPGVGIVAARAAGTSLGSPVDDLYTALNGTSMATPHVAGAAALLAASHPDWSREQLKDALISTADLGQYSPYEQGGGRVDVARAVTGPVTATGTVTLGDFTEDETGEVTRDITLTNTGTDDVELTLDLQLTDGNGEPTGSSVRLGADTVTVPAGGSANVPVTVDRGALPSGWHAGWVTATGGDVVVHTTVGVVKQPPIHTVTISAINREGEDSGASPVTLFGEDPRFDVLTFDKPGETLEVYVGEGDYFLHAMVSEKDQERESVIVDPDLEITGDMDLVLDAREANLVEIETPQPAEPRGNLGYITYRDIGSRTITHSTMQFDGTSKIHVTPTEPAKSGYFEFTSRWQLAAPMLQARVVGPRSVTLWPKYERSSPEVDFTRPVTVLDVGSGLAEDYEGQDVTGKAVVVHLVEKGLEDDAAQVAADAGAAMMLIAPEGTVPWWVKFTGRGDRLPLPVAVLSPEDAQQVAQRLQDRPLRLQFTGDQDIPYRYDVVQVSPHQVPERVVHTVSPENTTTVTANYHEMGGEPWSKEQRFAWRPWQSSTIVETQHELKTPQTRTEYISSGDTGTLWRQHVLHLFSWDTMNPINGGAIHSTRTYQPGESVTYDWYGGVQRPAVGPDGSSRTGDDLMIQVAEFVQGAAQTYARADSGEVTGRVLEDGAVIAEGPVWGTYTATKESATYQVEVSTQRTGADWEFGTSTDTVWTFESSRPAADATSTLPMMRVDYDVPTGLDHMVRTPRPFHEIGLSVAHPGMDDADRPKVTSLQAWASFDDGATWDPLKVAPGPKGTFTARITHKGRTEPVSLKVEAVDADGNSVVQTVSRAYGIG